MTDKLTAKQERFVEEYIVDLNATQAAIRAGYSEKTARQTGSENLSKPYIQEAIAEAKQNRSDRLQVTQDGVIKGLLREAQRDDDKATHAARVQAWAHLGRHLGMFTDKVEHSGSIELFAEQLRQEISTNGKTVIEERDQNASGNNADNNYNLH